jgi:hypothetical protein
VVARAPPDLVDRLASAAGLLEAVAELPSDLHPVVALVPGLAERSRSALDEWARWRAGHVA